MVVIGHRWPLLSGFERPRDGPDRAPGRRLPPVAWQAYRPPRGPMSPRVREPKIAS